MNVIIPQALMERTVALLLELPARASMRLLLDWEAQAKPAEEPKAPDGDQ